jgi:hypothetical protein
MFSSTAIQGDCTFIPFITSINIIMNWKINYWTLLFAAAMLGVLYLLATGGGNNGPKREEEPNCNAPALLTLPNGQTDIDRFQRLGVNDASVLNKNINSFKIPTCELRQMIAIKNPNINAVAELALKPCVLPDRQTGDKYFVTLYFKIVDTTNLTRIFDFTTPCPPCNDNFSCPN